VPRKHLHSSSKVHRSQVSSYLTLCDEIAAAYSANGTNHTNTICGQNEMSFSDKVGDNIDSCLLSQNEVMIESWLLLYKVFLT
jgi:hypothetical protein